MSHGELQDQTPQRSAALTKANGNLPASARDRLQEKVDASKTVPDSNKVELLRVRSAKFQEAQKREPKSDKAAEAYFLEIEPSLKAIAEGLRAEQPVPEKHVGISAAASLDAIEADHLVLPEAAGTRPFWSWANGEARAWVGRRVSPLVAAMMPDSLQGNKARRLLLEPSKFGTPQWESKLEKSAASLGDVPREALLSFVHAPKVAKLPESSPQRQAEVKVGNALALPGKQGTAATLVSLHWFEPEVYGPDAARLRDTTGARFRGEFSAPEAAKILAALVSRTDELHYEVVARLKPFLKGLEQEFIETFVADRPAPQRDTIRTRLGEQPSSPSPVRVDLEVVDGPVRQRRDLDADLQAQRAARVAGEVVGEVAPACLAAVQLEVVRVEAAMKGV